VLHPSLTDFVIKSLELGVQNGSQLLGSAIAPADGCQPRWNVVLVVLAAENLLPDP
jgi:hypothetical protein